MYKEANLVFQLGFGFSKSKCDILISQIKELTKPYNI